MSGAEALARLERVDLVGDATPLQHAPRLSEELGIELHLKRDDLTSVGLGGNKLRKLEFILGDAVAQGCDALVTFGAMQSNHARQSAAACARLGLACHLILTESVPRSGVLYERGGNVLLDELFGATLWHAGSTEDGLLEAISQVEHHLERHESKVRWTPPGGSEALGAIGYVAAGIELTGQCATAGIHSPTLVVASSTGGTQAGLILGCDKATVQGVAVYQPVDATIGAIDGLVHEVRDVLGLPSGGASRPLVDGSQFGDGYGVPTEASREALRLFARAEGIVLDPVYTAKAAAWLVAGCRDGSILAGSPVVFVHTGGSPGLFAYGTDAFG